MNKRVTLGIVSLAVAALGLAALPGNAMAQPAPELAPELYVYNWGDYIDPMLITEYEDTYGVRIIYDNYASNEELFAIMQAGAVYDVIFPTDYMIARMITLEMLAPLNHDNLPNLQHIDPFTLYTWFDPGGIYCIPYHWGTTGIAYQTRLDRVPDSWGALFDPEQAAYYADQGGINLLDDQRELIGAALLYLGYSLNDTDPDHLAEARDTIIDVLPYVRFINSSDYQDTLLIPGEVVISHSWDGSTVKAAIETESEEAPEGLWRHVVPREGAPRFQDGMCVPASSVRQTTAEHFINFLMEPEHAARTANAIGYLTANLSARAFLRPEILALFPTDEVLERLEWIRPLDEAGMLLWDQTWTEIRVSQ
jgi:spermidine/putrescine transport system substrate-binding protein